MAHKKGASSSRNGRDSAAQRLGVDVLDKGLSGSCGAEPAVAEFLVNECEWDFATCEWGVNMRHCVEPDDFRQRVHGCLDHFVPTGKPVFLITIFPSNADLGLAEGTIKAHLWAVYQVLGVQNRAQAMYRAHELNLFGALGPERTTL